ncbi:MAG: response regulator [Gammaproteobacteria bacterium]|nr:response regulator [Gammaproteobacteria bacterium]
MTSILVIDDSATSRALFRSCLPNNGDNFEISEAQDYETALEQAKSIQPDICVVDYNLPYKSGTEIAEAIMEAGIDTKFILMTANTQQSVIQRAEVLGFIGIIDKPVNPDKVLEALQKVA